MCAHCVARFAPDVPRCARCGLRTAAPVAACGACIADAPNFDSCSVACDYVFPWDRLIADFKFNAQVTLAHAMAQRMLCAIQRAGGVLPERVIPIPLASGRLAERGYNQAWELARRVAQGLGCRGEAQWLLRPADGAHQAQLTLAQRQRNLRGAFMVNPARRVSLQGRHVALVDDVMTSGSTLREATTVLRNAGAARVDVWVLARTPAPA